MLLSTTAMARIWIAHHVSPPSGISILYNAQLLALVVPLGFAVIGNVVYQLASRSPSAHVRPFTLLACAYFVAFVAASIIAWRTEQAELSAFRRMITQPAPLLMACGFFMIEVGFLFGYRAGAPISTAPLIVNSVVAAMLLAIGVGIFAENVSWRVTVGIAVTLIGVTVIISDGYRGGVNG